jgi:Arc/MetJ-type ribon-helix-helix transcriptional regulator
MTSKPVEFAVDDNDRARLQILVDYFGDGNRAEFLRIAIERLTREMRAEKMQLLQEQAREEQDRRRGAAEAGGEALPPVSSGR